MRADTEDIKDFINIFISMLALNLLSGNMGAFSPIFYRYVAVILLSILFMINAYKIHLKHFISKIPSIGFIIFGFIAIFAPQSKEYWLLGYPLVVFGIGIYLKELRIFFPLSLAGTLYAAFFLIQQYIPLFHDSISKVSIKATYTIGMITGEPTAFGSYISGLWVIATFFFLFTSYTIISTNILKSVNKFIISTLGLALCFILFVIIMSHYVNEGAYLINSQIILFILCVIPTTYFLKDFNHREITPKVSSVSAFGLICIIFISITLIIIFSYSAPPTNAKSTVVIYERNCAMDFDPIRFPEVNETLMPVYHPGAGGFLDYLEEAGYKVIRFGEQDNQSLKAVLKDANILMIANLEKPITSEELKVIWNFVERGGGLLIFADHTSVYTNYTEFLEGRDYFNDLLRPTNIRVNPDTSDWIITNKSWITGSWAYPLDIIPHRVTYGLNAQKINPTSVGASLRITGTAIPIVMAPWGFSDSANASNLGHLGNRRYEKGEPAGDIVLAAVDRYGKGKVIAFGDTSYIFPRDLPFEFILMNNIFYWLNKTIDGETIIPPIIPLTLGVISFVSLICLIRQRHTLIIALCPIIIILSLLSAGFINEYSMGQFTSVGSVAWIDTSHNNLVSFKGVQDNSINGLFINLIRNGYLPFVTDSISQISNGKMFIVIGPTKKFTTSEANLIKDFVYNGGILILSAGYAESESIDPILKVFGLNVVNTPLGSYPWIIDYESDEDLSMKELELYWHKPKFMEAYPLSCKGD